MACLLADEAAHDDPLLGGVQGERVFLDCARDLFVRAAPLAGHVVVDLQHVAAPRAVHGYDPRGRGQEVPDDGAVATEVVLHLHRRPSGARPQLSQVRHLPVQLKVTSRFRRMPSGKPNASYLFVRLDRFRIFASQSGNVLLPAVLLGQVWGCQHRALHHLDEGNSVWNFFI
jgi:hypothetical protein